MTIPRPRLPRWLALCVALSSAFAVLIGSGDGGTSLAAVEQTPADTPQIKILSPSEDAYLTGPTSLSATVTPSDAITAVTFFVDGRQVCALTALPYECEWDAGAAITAHQVRAVATIKGGARIVQTVRTKSVGYVERVDVDVVQVTVTVADGHGKFVRNLPQSAFHVLEDGRAQAVSHFASADVPLELVAAIDISGSMTPAMPKLKKAVKQFRGHLPPPSARSRPRNDPPETYGDT